MTSKLEALETGASGQLEQLQPGARNQLARSIGLELRRSHRQRVKARGDSNTVTVGFTGRTARIARVHQFGLKDRAERSAVHQRFVTSNVNY